MTLESAPKQLHDELDKMWPLVPRARLLGMSTQIILTVDKHGNLSSRKVNHSTGDSKTS